MDHPVLTAEIVTLDPASARTKKADGWGYDTHRTEVTGRVASIEIKKDGVLEFAIRITETGSLLFSDFNFRRYELDPVRHLRLTPAENWMDRP